MKVVLLCSFVLLLLSSVALYLSFPDVASEVPVIYWVTDPNPARQQQVQLFHAWMTAEGHTTADGKPVVQLRLDTANQDVSKKIIQGVSGVGSDIMDMGPLHYFVDIGLLQDVTEWGQEGSFGPEQTHPAIVPAITDRGRQYAFPCNVFTNMFWVNNATFRKYGIEPPTGRWTFEEFEHTGKQLDAAANPPGQRRMVFLAPYVPTQLLYQSMGLSALNESLTRCTIDDPRYAAALELKHKWMFEDHILPTAADQASFDTESGYAGSVLQLFNQGNYGMFPMGRFALIQLRKFGSLDLGLAEPPHGGFPNTQIFTRCASIYVGSENKELARYFLAYLAGEPYNMQIIRDADGLPPNPLFMEREEFSRPAEFPNEWGIHDAFAEAARSIAIPQIRSEFVLTAVLERHLTDCENGFINGRLTATEASRLATRRIDEEIARSLIENPHLKPLYRQRLAQQAEIERLRAAGETVPSDLIANPFYRKYYTFKGWSR